MSNAENVMCPHGMTLRDYFAAKAMGPAPGPWQDIGPIGAGKLIKAPEGLIAVVYGPNVNPASEANAHLIAACDPDTIRELLAERDALAAAMSQAPAVGEEIMVNAAHDVYTLPLQPSGLSSGPRFVVHVPADAMLRAVQDAWMNDPLRRTATMWRAMLAAAQQQPAGDGCHCATCTCNPGMTPAIRFDTSPAAQEGAVRDHLIALGWTPPGAQQPASVPVRVTWAEFWIAQGDWETANDYAAFEKAERWLLAQKPASVEERENEHG